MAVTTGGYGEKGDSMAGGLTGRGGRIWEKKDQMCEGVLLNSIQPLGRSKEIRGCRGGREAGQQSREGT